MDATFVIVPLLAVLAPLLAARCAGWISIPVVVFELVLGIVAGPSVLNWAGPSDFVATLAQLGLAMLFFVAGGEVEPSSFRGRTGRWAVLGWFVSFGKGFLIGWFLVPGETALIFAIALSSTALGTLLPILRDAGELHTPFGRAVGAIGAVGEFGPLIAISVLLGARAPGPSALVLVVFLVIAIAAIVVSVRVPTGRLHRIIDATLHSSGQIAVRIVLLILIALLALSLALDLDMLLGAFTAGIVWRLLMREATPADRAAVESKIEAVAFGFLVPVFFVYTGVTFDLTALIEQPVLFAFIPLVLGAMLVARGLPSLFVPAHGTPWRERIAVAFMSATGLPIIVAVTAIGTADGLLSPAAASVLVGAGLVSVLLFPVIGIALKRRTRAPGVPRETVSHRGGEE